MLNVAIAYTRRGWQVFPLAECSKSPKIPAAHRTGDPLRGTCHGACGRDGHGFYDATTDLEKILQWWTQWPNANIGLRTGVAFDVLDIDGPVGLASLSESAPYGGEDRFASIVGPTVITGGRGYHILVTVTGLGNQAGFIPSCDFRGDGGYVVAVGSMHRSGAPYRWLEGSGPDKKAISPAPEWLIESLTNRRNRAPSDVKFKIASSPYGRAAFEGELGRLVMTPEGERNDALNRAAFSLGQLIYGGELDAGEVIPQLLKVARYIGLTDTEIEGTIESGITAGSHTPRTAA